MWRSEEEAIVFQPNLFLPVQLYETTSLRMVEGHLARVCTVTFLEEEGPKKNKIKWKKKKKISTDTENKKIKQSDQQGAMCFYSNLTQEVYTSPLKWHILYNIIWDKSLFQWKLKSKYRRIKNFDLSSQLHKKRVWCKNFLKAVFLTCERR